MILGFLLFYTRDYAVRDAGGSSSIHMLRFLLIVIIAVEEPCHAGLWVKDTVLKFGASRLYESI
jgi:hypothetical protein